jgi:hypothetical protein
VRLLRHQEGKFTKFSTGEEIEQEKWMSGRKARGKVAQFTPRFSVSKSYIKW